MNLSDKILDDNKKFDKLIDKFCEKLKWEREVELRYVEKYRNLPVKERLEIFEKIRSKYSSKKYRDREYNKCNCEPREDLYYLLSLYAEKYGEIVDYDCESEEYYFTTGMWRLKEEGLIVERLDGQGTLIKVYEDNK